jgi:hypothetical protein
MVIKIDKLENSLENHLEKNISLPFQKFKMLRQISPITNSSSKKLETSLMTIQSQSFSLIKKIHSFTQQRIHGYLEHLS